MASNPVFILTEAINDVGYWRWWTSDLPLSFQVEFGGAQLRRLAPEGVTAGDPVALQFTDVGSVAFLTRAASEVSPDWPRQLAADAIEPFALSYDQFALMDRAHAQDLVGQAAHVELYAGADPRGADWDAFQSTLAFWAGPIGLSVGAQRFTVKDAKGEIALAEVQSMHDAWLEYWREYWRRRSSADPLPKDYACEVTIPINL